MKKFAYMMALGCAMCIGLAACEDDKEPVYHHPSSESFQVLAPALQNQILTTTGDIENKSTFELVAAGQPDYGFSTVCTYGAQVSLSADFTDEVVNAEGEVVTPATYRSIAAVNPSSSRMSLRTYDLGVALCSLLGISSPEDWEAYTGPKEIPVYFRATCMIPGKPESFVATGNSVTYNKVTVSYAVPTPGFIYIVGKLEGFTGPTESNKEHYDNYRLFEPVIGSKVYAGVFEFPACEPDADPNNVDDLQTFRFFTELKGWDDTAVQFGSHADNFYVLNISNDFKDGLYKGDAVWGQGNYGVYLAEPTPMTLVADLQVHDKPVVYFMFGAWDVSLEINAAGMWAPVFNEPVEE